MGQGRLRHRRAMRRRSRWREGLTVRQFLRRQMRLQRRTRRVILALHHRDVLFVVFRDGHGANVAHRGSEWEWRVGSMRPSRSGDARELAFALL